MICRLDTPVAVFHVLLNLALAGASSVAGSERSHVELEQAHFQQQRLQQLLLSQQRGGSGGGAHTSSVVSGLHTEDGSHSPSGTGLLRLCPGHPQNQHHHHHVSSGSSGSIGSGSGEGSDYSLGAGGGGGGGCGGGTGGLRLQHQHFHSPSLPPVMEGGDDLPSAEAVAAQAAAAIPSVGSSGGMGVMHHHLAGVFPARSSRTSLTVAVHHGTVHYVLTIACLLIRDGHELRHH